MYLAGQLFGSGIQLLVTSLKNSKCMNTYYFTYLKYHSKDWKQWSSRLRIIKRLSGVISVLSGALQKRSVSVLLKRHSWFHISYFGGCDTCANKWFAPCFVLITHAEKDLEWMKTRKWGGPVVSNFERMSQINKIMFRSFRLFIIIIIIIIVIIDIILNKKLLNSNVAKITNIFLST